MGGGKKKKSKSGNQGGGRPVVGGITFTTETSKKGKAAEASTSKTEPTTRPSKNATNVEVPAVTNPAGASCNSKRQNNTVGQRKNKATKVPTVEEKPASEPVENLDKSETASGQVEIWDKDVSQLDTHGGNKAVERPQNFNDTPLNKNSEASIGTKNDTWFDNNTVQPMNQPVPTNSENWDDSEPENTDNSNMEMYPSEGESFNQATSGYVNIKSSYEDKHEKTLKEQASVNPYHASDSSSATAKFSRYKNTSIENAGMDQSETSRSGGNNSRDSSDFSSQGRRSDDSDLLMPYNKKINDRYSDDYNKNSNRTSQRFSNKKVWGTDSGSSSYGKNDGSSSTSDSRVSYSPSRGNENWWAKNSKQQDFKSNKDNTERKSDGSQNKIGHWRSNESDRSLKRNKSRDRKSNSDWDVGSYSNKNYTRITGDKEFDEFWKVLKTWPGNSFEKVDEIHEDLFKMPKEYALAHCVAEDMNMGSGIAVQFSQQFKRRDELYQQRQRQGGLAVLQVDDERYIYYLVTKKYSNGKPNTYTMWSSLMKLQQHIEEHQVKKLAIPRIGCGLDRLEWSEVKPMIEYIFRNTDIKITVCNFQQPEDGSAPTPPPKSKKCPVVNVPYSLNEIAGGTAIVYLGTEDGYVSEELKLLDNKFRILIDYNNSKRQVGEILQAYKNNKDFCLYGFIVKKTKDDPVNFVNFQKCIMAMRKLNKNDYYYVGIEAFLDEDDLIMNKIVNLLRYTLFNMEVYVCWSGKMKPYMPQDRRDDYF